MTAAISPGWRDGMRYATELGWPIFPCNQAKEPLVAGGFKAATTDWNIIEPWTRRWPDALVALATGARSGVAVLDVDVKRPGANGFSTLAQIDSPILSWTPIVRTPSGGAHCYYRCPPGGFPCTQGSQGAGIGVGLDWRCNDGYVILAVTGSGYQWDPAQNLETAALAEIPPQLMPRDPEPRRDAPAPEPTSGLSRYAEAALRSACENILHAGPGEQEATLHRESFSIGTLAASSGIPSQFALDTLRRAASCMRDYDPRRPWRAATIQKKVERSFAAGMQHPRGASHA